MCIIAVDYDGTITADFNKARAALKKLKDAGHTIVIWSSRNNPHQHGLGQPGVYAEMISKLQEHRIPYDDVDRGDVGKFHAQVYIDDKAWRFENNWDEIVSRIY
jgi:hypothetical protein